MAARFFSVWSCLVEKDQAGIWGQKKTKEHILTLQGYEIVPFEAPKIAQRGGDASVFLPPHQVPGGFSSLAAGTEQLGSFTLKDILEGQVCSRSGRLGSEEGDLIAIK